MPGIGKRDGGGAGGHLPSREYPRELIIGQIRRGDTQSFGERVIENQNLRCGGLCGFSRRIKTLHGIVEAIVETKIHEAAPDCSM